VREAAKGAVGGSPAKGVKLSGAGGGLASRERRASCSPCSVRTGGFRLTERSSSLGPGFAQ
jgi:hypothetical protein